MSGVVLKVYALRISDFRVWWISRFRDLRVSGQRRLLDG